MRECYVSFASVTEVHEFVTIATRHLFPIRVETENRSTDAKSIMGLFSMGLHRPLRVTTADTGADAAHFFSALQPYLVG